MGICCKAGFTGFQLVLRVFFLDIKCKVCFESGFLDVICKVCFEAGFLDGWCKVCGFLDVSCKVCFEAGFWIPGVWFF
jgi:hypothetical protein